MWEELDVQRASSVCCRGQKPPGWVASGVLPHRDPGIQPYLSGAPYRAFCLLPGIPHPLALLGQSQGSFHLRTITLSLGEGPAQEVWPNRP